VRAEESIMVGDSLLHDIEGALRVGMRGVLVHRGDGLPETVNSVPVVRTLAELPALIW
jgi:FMN phosphatase YigB (HAD superfamily)